MKKLLYILITSLFLYSNNINLAIAANVKFVIDELIKEFNKENNITITYTLGSSAKLASQILYGAKYDIFLSANSNYPNIIYKKGIGVKKPQIYAKGILTVISNKIKIKDLQDIQLAKKIVIPNPKTAPYGIAAKEALIKSNFYKSIKNKLILAQSVAQTYYYFSKDLVDIAFIAKSATIKKPPKYILEVNSILYSAINQAAILLTPKQEANRFYNFLFSAKAKEIFKKYGYR